VTLGVFASSEFDTDPLTCAADYNAFINLFGDSDTCISWNDLERRPHDRPAQGWYRGGSIVTWVIGRIDGCDLLTR